MESWTRSPTVRSSSTSRSCSTRATVPARVTVPESGIRVPASTCSSVVLPRPFSPTTANRDPAETVTSTSFSTVRSPRVRVMLSARMWAALPAGRAGVFRGVRVIVVSQLVMEPGSMRKPPGRVPGRRAGFVRSCPPPSAGGAELHRRDASVHGLDDIKRGRGVPDRHRPVCRAIERPGEAETGKLTSETVMVWPLRPRQRSAAR